MCAIAGIFHRRAAAAHPINPAVIEQMCTAMAHRGPDGAGVWSEQGIGLGHRRLSVIDVAGSPQPMPSVDGRAVISFNGEIYNFRELRRELEAEGARFKSDGDTEVILAAYQRWGVDCLKHLDGMFAFALYDTQKRQLLLARDRLGVKPLYLSELSDGSLAFASELKGLLAHPLLERRLDLAALDDFMTWGYVPDTRSILAGIRKLPAGHFLLLERDKEMPASTPWWDVSFAERHQGNEAELGEELRALLGRAVQTRMRADVPLGAFLSGGVDSSTIVALMAEASAQPVQTCSIGFDVAALDETPYAQRIADTFATDHRARVVGTGDFAHIDKLAAMFDEPFADASALPTWRVCELAREKVTVALSGDGADEAFAGYRRQVFHAHEERIRARVPAGLRGLLLGGLGQIWPKADWAPRPLRAKATLLALAGEGDEGYARALSLLTRSQRFALYGDTAKGALHDYRAEESVTAMMRAAPAREGLDRAQYVDLKFWLPGDILTKIDRTSMAVSLEAREPMLDHRLIEFGARLPLSMRVRGRQGKFLLKQSMEGTLAHDILYRPKQGFVTPIAQWLKGPLADTARALSQSRFLIETGLFDASALERLASTHIAGRADNARALWQLIMLEKSLAQINPAGIA